MDDNLVRELVDTTTKFLAMMDDMRENSEWPMTCLKLADLLEKVDLELHQATKRGDPPFQAKLPLPTVTLHPRRHPKHVCGYVGCHEWAITNVDGFHLCDEHRTDYYRMVERQSYLEARGWYETASDAVMRQVSDDEGWSNFRCEAFR